MLLREHSSYHDSGEGAKYGVNEDGGVGIPTFMSLCISFQVGAIVSNFKPEAKRSYSTGLEVAS